MKKILDFFHDYRGYGNCESVCRVTIWEDSEKNVVLFTDEGKGTSVTNFSEHLANQMKKHFTRSTIMFFETYKHNEHPDGITYEVKDGQYCLPTWHPTTSEAFQNLTEL